MSTPVDVLRKPITEPVRRMQNVAAEIQPPAVEGFEHHAGYSVVSGTRARFLSAWAFPWWLSDMLSAPVTCGFSTAFSSAFCGGVDSPQGTAFSTAYSSAFS